MANDNASKPGILKRLDAFVGSLIMQPKLDELRKTALNETDASASDWNVKALARRPLSELLGFNKPEIATVVSPVQQFTPPAAAMPIRQAISKAAPPKKGMTKELAELAKVSQFWEGGKKVVNPDNGQMQSVLRTKLDPKAFTKDRVERLAKYLESKGVPARAQESTSSPGEYYVAIPATKENQAAALHKVQAILEAANQS